MWIDRLNVLTNALMTLSSGAFYLMIFTNTAPGFDAAAHFRPRSYWTVRIGLSFVVAGSLFATLTMPHVSLAQLVRNLGIAVLFSWAAVYHARRWGVLLTPTRKTGTFPVVK